MIPSKNEQTARPLALLLTAGWHLVVALALVVASFWVFRLDVTATLGQAANLGRPVQVFAAALTLVVGGVNFVAAWWLWQTQSHGRLLSMAINVAGATVAWLFVIGFWGGWQSFEAIVDGVLANGYWTLGIALGYALFWAGGRMPENSGVGNLLELAGIGTAMLTLMVLLWFSGLLGGIENLLASYANPATWIMTAIAVTMSVLAWRMISMGEYFGETPFEREAWQGWLLLAPNIIWFVLFLAGPLLLSLYLSFTDSSVGRIPSVIGFENYAEILTLQLQTTQDTEMFAQNTLDFGFAVLADFQVGGTRYILGAKDVLFWISMRNTLLFCLMLLPLAILPALGMSLVLNSRLPGVKFFRAVYFLPSVAAVVGTALIWRWLYQPTEGFINYSIRSVAAFLNVADPNIGWLSDASVVLLSVVILAAWQVVGYNTVLFLAGLQGIPKVLYEAAQIDGASRWQQFTNVTLPMLAPTTFFVIITTMVNALKVFNEPYALFPSRPIPENATTAVYYLYQKGFPEGNFGYSSAIAWLLFLVIFGFTLVQFRANRAEAYE